MNEACTAELTQHHTLSPALTESETDPANGTGRQGRTLESMQVPHNSMVSLTPPPPLQQPFRQRKTKEKMKISISTTIFFLAFLFLCSDAFHQNSLFYNAKLIQGKTKALQTAGPQQGGFIPRLEPGLRLLKPHINSIYEMTGIEISSFPLDKLKEVQNALLPPSGDSVVGPQRIPLDGLFKRALEDIGKASRIIVYYLKRFLAMSMILMSTWSMPTLRRLSYVTASAVTALISGPRMIANAATPQKYQKLTPYQKVGTTPLYYVCNSRGNSYLQEDVQV